jgi:hypothetical protein
VADGRAFERAPWHFRTEFGGLFLFIPLLVALRFEAVIARVPLPGSAQMQDFLVEDRLISPVGDHLTGVTGGAEGGDSYASFFLLASLRALTPR